MIQLSQTYKFMSSPQIPSLTYKVTALSPQNVDLGDNCFEHGLDLTLQHLVAHFHMDPIQIDQSSNFGLSLIHNVST